jgi:hypothetical protein
MRTFGLVLLLSSAAFGQYRGSTPTGGVRSSGVTTTGGGFGNVLFPGGYVPGQTRPTAGVHAGPAQHGRRFPGPRGGGAVFIPYAYPYYLYDSAPAEAAPQAPAPAPPPTIIINNNYIPERSAGPVVREYNFEPAASAPADGVRVYGASPAADSQGEERKSVLIAFKDHTIYAAFTYWLEGETLHYVTNHGTHNQVSLGLVDRELSERLNRERGVEFHLR